LGREGRDGDTHIVEGSLAIPQAICVWYIDGSRLQGRNLQTRHPDVIVVTRAHEHWMRIGREALWEKGRVRIGRREEWVRDDGLDGGRGDREDKPRCDSRFHQ